MYLFVYKTTHKNGKFYIGRHQTKNLNDGYLGSGKWVKSIKDKSTLSREILAEAYSVEELFKMEEFYINKHYDDPLCMNYIKGSNGWTSEDSRRVQQNRIATGNHPLLKRADGSSIASDMVKAGTHHLLLREDGSSVGAETNAKRIAEGSHNFLGRDGKKSQSQINAENEAWWHWEETVPCYNKNGEYIRVSAEQFYSQSGPQDEREWVHNKSIEGIKRKNNGVYIPTRAKGKVPCYNKNGEYKRIPKSEYYDQVGDPVDWVWVHFSSHEGKKRASNAGSL